MYTYYICYMKNATLIAVLILFGTMAITACTKHEAYIQSGGNLPTNYIIIGANGSLSPATLQVVSGSSITFINNDTQPHNIISNDSITIVTGIIASNSSFLFKKDNAVGTFSYRCTLTPVTSGIIIITP